MNKLCRRSVNFKRDFCYSRILPKKERNNSIILPLGKKRNLYVHSLEESSAWKKHYSFGWPLIHSTPKWIWIAIEFLNQWQHQHLIFPLWWTLYSMSFHTMACRISGLGFDFSFKFIWARCECIQISLLSRHNIIKIFLLKIGPNTFQVWNLTLTSWGSKCQRYCDKKEGKNLRDAIHNGVKVFMNSLSKFTFKGLSSTF